MKEINIGAATAIGDPGRRVISVDGAEVGIFCRDGKVFAYENVCPHMGGPVCQGKMLPRTEEAFAADRTSLGLAFSDDRTNVACPWHGFEFDITTGIHHGDERVRLRTVPVRIEGGDIIVSVPENLKRQVALQPPGTNPSGEAAAP